MLSHRRFAALGTGILALLAWATLVAAQPLTVDLEPENSKANVTPGGAHTYELRVSNTASTPHTFNITIRSQTSGWAGSLSASTMTLSGGQSSVVHLQVAPPSDASPGAVGLVRVRAANGAVANDFDEVTTNTTVVAPTTTSPAPTSASGGSSPPPESLTPDATGSPVPDTEDGPSRKGLTFATGSRETWTATGTVSLGGLVALAWASEPFRLRWRILALALFSRLDRGRVLDHGLRERVFDAIRRTPGVHYGGLQRELAVPAGTLAHHLHVLEREELVRSQTDGFRRRFYPRGRRSWGQDPLTEAEQRLVEAIATQPGMTQRDVARHLGLSKQVVNYHLLKLERLGRVHVEREGREAHCYPGRGAGSGDQAELSSQGTA